MSGRYLVGFDGSSPSQSALAWTIRRAHRLPRPIVLVHVAEGDDGAMGGEFENQSIREGAALLSGRVAELRHSEPQLQVDGMALVGNVTWELARVVSPDDLLVVGTHKTGFLHGRVLGSRSVQIAAAAGCSVAVIPEVDLRFRSGVVAGIDRVSSAGAIAEFAADEAAARSEELSLVEAAPSGSTVTDSEPLSAATHAARLRHPELVIRSRMSARGPAEALLDAARDKALLVLGPGSGLPERSPIGSVMHDVLLNVNAPVLVARPSYVRADAGDPRPAANVRTP